MSGPKRTTTMRGKGELRDMQKLNIMPVVTPVHALKVET
jgi:hypothetical protein